MHSGFSICERGLHATRTEIQRGLLRSFWMLEKIAELQGWVEKKRAIDIKEQGAI